MLPLFCNILVVWDLMLCHCMSNLDVSKDYSASIFRVKQPKTCLILKIEGLWLFETSGIILPVTWLHIPEDISVQQQYCENLRSCGISVSSVTGSVWENYNAWGGGLPPLTTYLLLHCVCVLNVTCLPFTFVYVPASSLCLRTGDRISVFYLLCLIAYS